MCRKEGSPGLRSNGKIGRRQREEWCGRVSVVEGKERGRELWGEEVQVDRRADRRRKGREQESEKVEQQSRNRPYWSRLRERGPMSEERNGMGDGDGWMDMGLGWDDCLWGEGGGAMAGVQCSPGREYYTVAAVLPETRARASQKPASETAENGGALKWR